MRLAIIATAAGLARMSSSSVFSHVVLDEPAALLEIIESGSTDHQH